MTIEERHITYAACGDGEREMAIRGERGPHHGLLRRLAEGDLSINCRLGGYCQRIRNLWQQLANISSFDAQVGVPYTGEKATGRACVPCAISTWPP